jgi:hypothetical protein
VVTQGAAKTALLKVNVIKAVDLIGKALHATRLPEGKKVRALPRSQRSDDGVLAC